MTFLNVREDTKMEAKFRAEACHLSWRCMMSVGVAAHLHPAFDVMLINASCRRTAAEVDTGWMDILWMLANLTGLVAGELQTNQQKVSIVTPAALYPVLPWLVT